MLRCLMSRFSTQQLSLLSDYFGRRTRWVPTRQALLEWKEIHIPAVQPIELSHSGEPYTPIDVVYLCGKNKKKIESQNYLRIQRGGGEIEDRHLVSRAKGNIDRVHRV